MNKTMGDTKKDLTVDELYVNVIAEIDQLKFRNTDAITVGEITNAISENRSENVLVTDEAVVQYAAKLNGDITKDFSAKKLNASDSIQLNGTEVNAITKVIPSKTNNTTLPTTQAVSDFVLNNAVPIGSVTMYAGYFPKKDGDKPIEVNGSWLVCDGSLLNLNDYKELFDVIGVTYGNSNVGYFYIPDCRGLFVRGVDGGSNTDPDFNSRTTQKYAKKQESGIGTVQDDVLKAHAHELTFSNTNSTKNSFCWAQKANHSESDKKGHGSTEITGGNETRPKNIAFYYIIKYKHV